jgi:hypothetical protein
VLNRRQPGVAFPLCQLVTIPFHCVAYNLAAPAMGLYNSMKGIRENDPSGVSLWCLFSLKLSRLLPKSQISKCQGLVSV